MFYRLAIAFALCCFTQTLSAQSDQYIVKLNGDTLRGKLLINPARDNSTTMYFKHADGSKENIRPIRISYVYYDDEFQFRSVPFYNQRLFMQILKEDRNLSYYNYIHKRDNSIGTTKVAIKPNGDALELSAITFRKQVTEFLEDCPKVVVKVENKVYRYKDYEQLFADYNDCDIVGSQAVATSSSSAPGNPGPASGTGVTTGVTASANSASDKKLAQLDEFRKYVRGLDSFDHSRDVLEWLTDVEYRISQGKEIPNYLWSSLNAMTDGNQELQNKADQLQQALSN